ncbi:PspC domain-containing protein [Streptomyces sp. V4-01]|uniref:PspC domain-containing protein n=1 Tax=Actinacidiphila polyblastidii TaxID=3110430 RepID=A0ABU7P7K7_9ACTN|nr:PspC domain-containing protein [Streptomyces sp. V4-01]
MTDHPAPGPADRAPHDGAAAEGDTAQADAADGGGRPRPRLTRGRDKEKVLAGVCAGAGRYFGVDPVIFRVVLAVLSLTGGIGLIVYGMGWLVVPQEGERESEAQRLLSGRIEGAPLTAVLMALVGCGLYASMIGNGANQAFSLVLLAATAGAVYWSQQRRRLEEAGQAPFTAAGTGGATRAPGAVPDAPPAVQAPPEPGATSWWREPLTKEPAYLWGPDDGPYGASDKRAWKQRMKAAPERRNWVFSFLLFVAAVAAAGIGAGASWPYQPAAVSAEIGLAAALGVLGAGFVIASFAGRARGGTVFWALVTVAGLIGAAALPKSGQGAGSQTWRPSAVAAVQPSYERGAGRGVLDLTALPLAGRTVRTRLEIGAGEARVRLPRDATVRIDYDLGVGAVELPDQPNDGVQIKKSRHGSMSFDAPAGTMPAGTIDLEVSVGVGKLEVIR